jgi:hypothetical protein
MKRVFKFKNDSGWYDANQPWDEAPEAEAVLSDMKVLIPDEPVFGKREYWIGWKRSREHHIDVPFILTEKPHWLESSAIHVIEYEAYVRAKNGK